MILEKTMNDCKKCHELAKKGAKKTDFDMFKIKKKMILNISDVYATESRLTGFQLWNLCLVECDYKHPLVAENIYRNYKKTIRNK